ncbi:hypothetical protein Poli38472_011277 [Pythium oligandrum]|uniref:PDZ domain-containing protein n=1 Tax=Pythium oligandrum TaxID=41045 RepID=A0A8K1CPZ5_PYTOL|nr:hypothetical protein Poli38472_011277 [Pythium oligandrum]|eukprot:TMW67657.1 hypothetical protein Poli38472_011277 [Pythium oligandrum]
MTTTTDGRTREALPPLFAHVLRYAPGDRVHTPYGQGVVMKPSDGQAHVQVQLAFGATLFARRGCLMPEFRMLECGEIPKGTKVLCKLDDASGNQETEEHTAHLREGVVQSYILREEVYQIHLDEAGDGQANPVRCTKHQLRFAPTTRVRVKIGLGSVAEYREESDSYVVNLDFGGVGYFSAPEVSVVDLRLLSKMPKPMTADAIYAEFQGRITHDDAAKLAAKAQKTYATVQKLCEENATAISFLSTNAAYGEQYSSLFTSILDPTLSDASKRLKTASAAEIAKLKTIARDAKRTLESQLLDGKDVNVFVAQATSVLSKLKNSTEVKDFQASIRAKAKEEFQNARDHLHSSNNADQQVHDQHQHQRLVLSQVIQTLEAKVNGQKAKFASVKDVLDRDKMLQTLQKHEADLAKAREALIYLEKLASNRLGVDSITTMEPLQLIAKAEELLPQITARAEVLKESGEKYFSKLQETTKGQALIQQAKQLVASVENPDAFCENVTKAIADVQLDKIAAWGTTLTTNRQKRQEFIDRVKDHCLDFFMSVLPTIKVDTISGIQDGIEYSLTKLDLSNFRVRKERVKVRMGTVADEELFTVRATHLTALLKGFQWTFAQKYFPYAHGGGAADADLTGGVISLGFKAEKKVVNAETGEFKPTLVLNSMEIEIRQELKISVQGSWFSAIYNLLTSAFAQLIREYIAKTMESKLLKHMIKLLTTLNAQMDKYWPLVFQLLDIRVEDLPSASPWRGAKEVEIQPYEMEHTFTDRHAVPFTFAKGVLNRYVVVGRVLEMDATDPVTQDLLQVPLGSGVLAINGLACNKLTLDEFNGVLETIPEPFTLRLSLVPDDTSKNRTQRPIARPQFCSVTFKQSGPFGLRLRNRPLSPFGAIVLGFAETADKKKSPAELSGKVQPGHLLLKINDIDLRFKKLPEILEILKETKRRPATMHFAASPDGIIKLREWPPMLELEPSDEDTTDGRQYVSISAFTRIPSFAQKIRVVERGDILWKMNGEVMTVPTQPSFEAIMDKLKALVDAKEPMRAVFVPREEYAAKAKARAAVEVGENNQEETTYETQRELVFPKPPLGVIFGNWKEEAAYIRLFVSSAGPAERSGLINVGQAVLQICGKNVPMDATPQDIDQMVHDVLATQSDAANDDPFAKLPTYSITLRDLDLEREIMKQ